jgi:hypothetical protein
MISTSFLTVTCHHRCSLGAICRQLFIAKEGAQPKVKSLKQYAYPSIVCPDYEECCLVVGVASCTRYRIVRVRISTALYLRYSYAVDDPNDPNSSATWGPRSGNSSEQAKLQHRCVEVNEDQRLKDHQGQRTKYLH